jgi:Tfp pilus assembly protein PilF
MAGGEERRRCHPDPPDPHQPRARCQRPAGYAKLQGNQLDAARHDYELALKSDPNNVDALLALAAIAQRQGRSADADALSAARLDADPRDPGGAQAAVLGSGKRRRPAWPMKAA